MKNKHGQTALILILLTAAALIFMAITMNWGHIAQTKAQLTIAADQAAAFLASSPASYGEMQKQEYLKDENELKAQTGIITAIVAVIVAIILVVLAFFCPPCSAAAVAVGMSEGFLEAVAVASAVMATVNLVLQVAVVQPGITALWNKMQRDQPPQEQAFEQGISTALGSVVGDQVNLTDYFDSNSNGVYGLNGNFPADSVGRYAFFYNERLKMLNQNLQPNPQVVFFYNQLGELMNGETCAQNASDVKKYGFQTLPICAPLDCADNPTNPACQIMIPGGFQLNDACPADSASSDAAYNPYCDPCCQPTGRPANCPQPSNPTICSTNPNDPSCLLPAPECITNNPYGSSYPFIYDPSFQNFGAKLSFLDQFGRDQQLGPFTNVTPNVMSPVGVTPVSEFPNGVYPFFWETKSLDVTNVNPANSFDQHWCSATVAPGYTNPEGMPFFNQLSLGYTCQGQDCCVGDIPSSVTNGVPSPSGGMTIDIVGSNQAIMPPAPSIPVINPGLDSSFGPSGTGALWTPGDNQMCLLTWPYNGSNITIPDGTCELTGSGNLPPSTASASTVPNGSTLDNVDYVMHSLTDFVKFSNTFLGDDTWTLSSNFQTWFPQVANFIGCDDGSTCGSGGTGLCQDSTSCGSLLNIYNPYSSPPLDLLNQWTNVITSWQNNNYTNTNAWCVPPEATLLAQSQGSTVEDQAIEAGGTWGGLSSVIACLNYNASSTPANNYQGCLAALQPYVQCYPPNPPNGLPNTLPSPACDPATLGRSLTLQGPPGFATSTTTCYYSCPNTCCAVQNPDGSCKSSYSCPYTISTVINAPPAYCPSSSSGCTAAGSQENLSTSCDASVAGSYAKWVNDSYTLASDEAPKFALRSAFLTDAQTRAQNMTVIFPQADAALQSFLKPCGASDTSCQTGGPAAQLSWSFANPQASPSGTLPTSVIYGWVDNATSNSSGYAHIVKVTAYSAARNVNSYGKSYVATSLLPWIQTKVSGFLGSTRTFTLQNRDAEVYVSVKRWDEDHNPISFPNGRTLWQNVFHNTNGGGPSGSGKDLFSQHNCTSNGGSTFGFGLTQNIVDGFQNQLAQPGNGDTNTPNALSNAFMLNDNGNGAVDSNAAGSGYNECLTWANQMLCNAPESHACTEYIASRNPSEVAGHSSGPGSSDYSLIFVSCSQQPEDLTGGVSCS